jgi:hypothetical protein
MVRGRKGYIEAQWSPDELENVGYGESKHTNSTHRSNGLDGQDKRVGMKVARVGLCVFFPFLRDKVREGNKRFVVQHEMTW